jgi:hypothetical protein
VYVRAFRKKLCHRKVGRLLRKENRRRRQSETPAILSPALRERALGAESWSTCRKDAGSVDVFLRDRHFPPNTERATCHL